MESKREHNFKTCCDGLACAGKALLPYTEGGLRTVHQRVYRQLAGLPLCTDRCSETHGNRTRRWCNTCSQWKMKLEKCHRRSDRIPWQNTKSWTWPYTKENIADVFMPSWYNAIYNLCDISAVCSLLRNCREFNVNPNITRRVADLRNEYYGHNVEHKVSDRDKAKLFDALKDFIKDADVKMNIDYLECYEELCVIETSEDKYSLLLSLSRIYKKEDEDLQKMQQRDDRQTYLTFNVRKVLLSIFVVILTMPFIYDMQYVWNRVNSFNRETLKANLKEPDCVSDMFLYPFPQDLPFLPYIREHKQLIGRDWLLQEVEQAVLQTKQNKRGLTVVAEMGYGKSAFISHILCANKSTSAWNLRRYTTAFHICKFDVPSTRKVGRFIRRLIGFFSTHRVQFGSEIAQLGESSLVYSEEKCNNEPIACLDQGVIFPLSKTQSDTPRLIIIDALDECYDHEAKQNHILFLLKDRMKKFPHWVRFLIFSRNIKEIDKLKHLPVLHLNASDPRNIKDIEDYLDSQTSFIERVYELFGKESKWKILKQIIKQSEGNFLFVSYSIEQAVDYLLQTKDTLPLKLSDFYESNFERQFPTETDFRTSKIILQVVCASFNPLTKSDIQNILHVNNITDIDIINSNFIKLSFFLRIEKEVTFVHKSIHDWLISNESSHYRIDPEKGHAYLSHYLIQNVKMNRTNFVEMTIHVAKSKQKNIRKIYKSLKREFLDIPANAVHQLINLTDSVAALKLVLPLFQNRIDIQDNGFSPAFLTAMNGHRDQLKLLLEWGSDINFVFHFRSIELPRSDNGWENVMQRVDFVKRHYFGNNLLHVATFHNNLDVVKYLLQINVSLMLLRNDAGQLPSDIACEFGLKEILRKFIALKPNVVREYCTYLAAKNGHAGIISLIKELNCECISDISSVAALDDTVRSKTSYSVHFVVLHYDNWWRVFKESPLHIAARKGHKSVVEILSSRCPGMLNCKDGFGRTPFLASIWYNQQHIFELLSFRVKHTIAESCTHNDFPGHHNKLTFVFSPNFLELLSDKQCPDGFSVGHLLAKFDRFDMILYLTRTKLMGNIDWSLLDNAGYPPEHYAACSASLSYLLIYKEGYLPGINVNKRRYKDGMTVYHSAAMCGQYKSIRMLKNLFDTNTIPKLYDENGRGVLIYSVLKRVQIFNDKVQISHSAVVKELINDGHSLGQTDLDGRNVLHHSLINGYVGVSVIIQDINVSVWLNLLQQKDMTGKTPIELSISENIESRSHFTKPQTCSFFDIYYKGVCTEDIKNIMSPWELTIYSTLLTCFHEKSKYVVPSYLLSSIFVNSPYLTNSLVVLGQNTDEELNRHLKRAMRLKLPSRNMLRYSIISIARHKPGILHMCNQHFHNSPLHELVYSNDNTLTDDKSLSETIVLVRKYHPNPTCPDIRGFNILHYAVMGGGVNTAHELMQSGFPVTNKRVRHVDIPWMVLFSRFRTHKSYADCQDSLPYRGLKISIFLSNDNLYCNDKFLSTFISEHTSDLAKSDFCRNNTDTLSLVHLLSLHGMLKTLKVIRDNYGYDVLSCTTKDGFTPQYTWSLYNEDRHWSLIVQRPTDVRIPNPVAEEMLLYLLSSRSSDYYRIDPFKCIDSYHERLPWNRYDLRKCIKELSLISVLTAKFTDARSLKENNLIARVTHFFDDFLTFETIIKSNTFTCNAVKQFFKDHPELERFILHHHEVYHQDERYGRLVQYVVRSFKRLKGKGCRVFIKDSWRTKRLIGILDHVTAVIIPDIVSACFKQMLVTDPTRLIVLDSEFIRRRLSDLMLSENSLDTPSGKQAVTYLMTIRQQFKNLIIVKKTLLYQQIHMYDTHLAQNEKYTLNMLTELELLSFKVRNLNVFD